jgi:hypothetical protein
MVTLVAPVVLNESVLPEPDLTLAGLAVNDVIVTEEEPTVTIAVAVLVPPKLLAVSV